MRLPIGISDFRKIIEENYDFVDKSLFIKEIIDDAEVVVITRPRRFGKTLNMSMLRYFFAAEVLGKPTQPLFTNLNIQKAGVSYLEYQGKYSVIFLTLKDIKETQFASAYAHFCKLISELYTEHHFLYMSDKLYEHEKKTFKSILSQQATSANISESLKNLSEYLHRYYGVRPIVLIDEYDTPLQAGYFHGYYAEMIELLRGFLSAGLKDNLHLHKAVLTGILRVAKESLFSDLNNIEIYSVLRSGYRQYFGFTEEEVNELFVKAKLKKDAAAIRDWYNGYQIGKHVVYNPWSIINCLKQEGRLQPYWVNMSNHSLIQEQIAKSNIAVKQDLERLLQDQPIKQLVDEGTVFSDLKQSRLALWNLLLMTGYLKPVACEWTNQGAVCDLLIPNLEVKGLYQKIIGQWLSGEEGSQWYVNFLQDLLQGRIEEFEKKLQMVMLHTFSSWDVAQNRQESFYHGFMLGLLGTLSETHEIQSNRESGLGRYDVMIIPKDKNQLGIILEFKLGDKEEQLMEVAKSAVEQINQQNYVSELQQRGIKNSLKIGIGFNKKLAKVYFEKTNS